MIPPTRLDRMMAGPEVTSESPLEKLLQDKRRMETIRQKWNMKDTKHQKVPSQQWEGDDRS